MSRLVLAALALACISAGYRQATPGYRFQFPRDHFAHPDFKTEWWYYTGNVSADNDHPYGFELVFFRLAQPAEHSNPATAWDTHDLYLAHLALTDISARKFHHFERLNRAGPGIAGASFEAGRIWNGNWQSLWDKPTGSQIISAVEDGVRFNLRLTPEKPPVIHGVDGVSAKSDEPGHASYYVSFTRLAVEGSLNGVSVYGSAWMDHEWFSGLLSPTQQGWDWFSVQLDNRADLMLFEVRPRDPHAPKFLSGTYIDPAGRATHLPAGSFTLEPIENWTSPKTGARYPTHWRIAVPQFHLALDCAAAVQGQELVSARGFGPSYWEGAVRYSGSHTGVGYLEMTGYAGPAWDNGGYDTLRR